jgi:hypothetical protein
MGSGATAAGMRGRSESGLRPATARPRACVRRAESDGPYAFRSRPTAAASAVARPQRTSVRTVGPPSRRAA